MVLDCLDNHRDLDLMPHTKINSGWIADLKVFKRKYMYTFQNAEEVNDFLRHKYF